MNEQKNFKTINMLENKELIFDEMPIEDIKKIYDFYKKDNNELIKTISELVDKIHYYEKENKKLKMLLKQNN